MEILTIINSVALLIFAGLIFLGRSNEQIISESNALNSAIRETKEKLVGIISRDCNNLESRVKAKAVESQAEANKKFEGLRVAHNKLVIAMDLLLDHVGVEFHEETIENTMKKVPAKLVKKKKKTAKKQK